VNLPCDPRGHRFRRAGHTGNFEVAELVKCVLKVILLTAAPAVVTKNSRRVSTAFSITAQKQPISDFGSITKRGRRRSAEDPNGPR
jgi:hypothetical protein